MDKMLVAQTIDLDTGQISTTSGQNINTVVQGNSLSLRWEVTVCNAGKTADMSGCSCAVKAVRADGATIPIVANLSNNVLTATLPSACFAIIGKLDCFFDVIDSSGAVIMTVSELHLAVKRGGTDSIIDPGSAHPELSAAIIALTQTRMNCAGLVDVIKEADASYTVAFGSGQTYTVAVDGDSITITE